MENEFPAAIPEIPVENVDKAIAYYVAHLGFGHDWGGEEPEGIAGISKGDCRLFLTNRGFHEHYGNPGPVVIWLNLNSRAKVDELHEEWRSSGAKIVSPPESKPWKLHEFTAADLDGNMLRVFYSFAWETTKNGDMEPSTSPVDLNKI